MRACRVSMLLLATASAVTHLLAPLDPLHPDARAAGDTTQRENRQYSSLMQGAVASCAPAPECLKSGSTVMSDPSVPYISQDVLRNPSGSGYGKVKQMFHSNQEKHIKASRKAQIRGFNRNSFNFENSKLPYNPSTDGPEAPDKSSPFQPPPTTEDPDGQPPSQSTPGVDLNGDADADLTATAPALTGGANKPKSKAKVRSTKEEGIVNLNRPPPPPGLSPPLPVDTMLPAPPFPPYNSRSGGPGPDDDTPQLLVPPPPPPPPPGAMSPLAPPGAAAEAGTQVFGSTLTGLSGSGVASTQLLRDDLASDEPPNNPYGIPNICFKLAEVPWQGESAAFASDLGSLSLYCDFLRGLSSGFLGGFIDGYNRSTQSYRQGYVLSYGKARREGALHGEQARLTEAAAALSSTEEDRHEADLMTFAEHPSSRLQLLSTFAPPPSPPPPSPPSMPDAQWLSDLSVMSFDQHVLQELSLPSSGPYPLPLKAGTMGLEAPLPDGRRGFFASAPSGRDYTGEEPSYGVYESIT